jgi:hypothetical protein
MLTSQCITPSALPNHTQIAGILRGRANADAAGDGHCSTVLSVDATVETGIQLIASGGHAGDGTVKIWAREALGEEDAMEGPTAMET